MRKVRLTENFFLHEFTNSYVATRLGIDNCPNREHRINIAMMASFLQKLRDDLCEAYGENVQLFISSGYRSLELNREIKGSKTSDHLLGLAADITSPQVPQQELFMFIVNGDYPFKQLIDEFGKWVHVSIPESGLVPDKQVLRASKVPGFLGTFKTEYSCYDGK